MHRTFLPAPLRAAILAFSPLWILAVIALLLALVWPPQRAHAASVSLTLGSANLQGTYTGSGAIAAPSEVINYQAPVTFAAGTATGQADLMYSGRRTIAASSSETLDLYGGLTDAFGTTLNFAHVKAIEVCALSTNTNDVVVGNAGSNPFTGPLGGTTPTVTVKPGNCDLFENAAGAGWAVADSSTDNLKVANSSSGTSVTYDIFVIGTST